MRRTPHLGLVVVLCVLAVVFWTASPAQAVLCKTWTGYVKAREGSCKSWETEIPLPQGPQGEMGMQGPPGPQGNPGQSAADLCELGQILLGGGECVTPAELLALAQCGNGVVDQGEQCDLGTENGPTSPCSSTCFWNCPCTYRANLPEAAWIDQGPEWQGGSSSDSDQQVNSCTLSDPSDNNPEVNVSVDTTSETFRCQISYTDRNGRMIEEDMILDGYEAIGCARSLEDYATQLNANTNGISVSGGPPYECTVFVTP